MGNGASTSRGQRPLPPISPTSGRLEGGNRGHSNGSSRSLGRRPVDVYIGQRATGSQPNTPSNRRVHSAAALPLQPQSPKRETQSTGTGTVLPKIQPSGRRDSPPPLPQLPPPLSRPKPKPTLPPRPTQPPQTVPCTEPTNLITDVDSLSSGSSGESLSLSSHLGEAAPQESPAGKSGLALFFNKPKECCACGSSAVAYECRQCSETYYCESCRFDLTIVGAHDPTHAITAIHEQHCSSSRTFGDSVLSSADGTTSSYIFYNPCYICHRGIDDNELVHRCERCDYIACDDCFKNKQPIQHEHQLKEFQRRTHNSSVQESFLINKSRNSDGNRIINDYVVVRLLGQGSYAKVKLVQHIRSRELFALKILKRAKKKPTSLRAGSTGSGVSSDDDLLREIAVMKFVQHPNIVQLKEVIDDVESLRVYIIMEYCEKGPVHVLGDAPLPMNKVRDYGSGIMRGLLHLHSEFLYHRDVKPANCLVDCNDVVKIADFGTCNSRIKTNLSDGTPAFNCPEQINSTEVSGDVVDSWGFALTLYQIAFGKLPFKATTYFDVRSALTSSDPVAMPNDCRDPQLRDLLVRMLNKNLEKRMLLEDAALHPFFSFDSNIRDSVLNRRRASASTVSTTALGSQPRLSVTASEDLYLKALESVHRGKNLMKSFHGIRAMRNLRRKEAKTAEENDVVLSDGEAEMDEFEGLNKLIQDGAAAADDHDSDAGSSASESVSQVMEGETSIKRCNDASIGIVLGRINAMREKKKTNLDLNRIMMSVPPVVVGTVQDELTELRFAYNGLKSVASLNFARFSLLQEISITSNKLAHFPETVFSAKRLVRLDLSNNQISRIPLTIRKEAPFLERLNLHRNNIQYVGTDANGYSVLAGHSLHHVRLSSNMVEQLPEQLETTSHLELVLDAHPKLMDQWSALVTASRPNPPPAVVIWDDYFPVLLQQKTYGDVWIATGALSLYRVNTLRACKAKHVVLFQQCDPRFPTGRFDKTELTTYFEKLAAGLGARLKRDNVTMPKFNSMAPLRSLPRVVDKASRGVVSDYFFISRSPEDEDGGYVKLYEYINDALSTRQPIIFFMTGGVALQETRENTVAALADSLSRNSPDDLEKQYEVVIKAMRGMYS